MEAIASAVTIHRPLAAEEAARADFYALLARLFHSAPDARLLAQMASASALPEDGDPDLGRAWRDMVAASSVMDADAAAEEYEALFAGVGKAPVSIYAGFHAGAMAVDHPRVRLQAEMARLGLARRDGITEPEDHFAGIFEMMRVLVAGGAGRGPASLAEQKRVFDEHVRPGARKFFDAVRRAEQANYYRTVAAFGAAFLALETESFDLD